MRGHTFHRQHDQNLERAKLLLASVAVAALVGSASPLWAQEAGQTSADTGSDATTLKPITITARRDAEDISSVPVSVGLASSATIMLESPSNASVDVSRNIPNYNVNDVGNPLFAFGAIRGVGTLSFPMNPFDSTISYAQNGMPISMYSGSQQYLDVTRVEVLRGPQNVLFGRASQGGTINIVTGEPDGTRDIRVRGEYGSNNEYLTDLIAGGEILPDVLNGRGAIRLTGGKGDVKNLTDGSDLPDRNIAAGRGSLRWFAGDNTTITATGYFERDERKTFNYILRDSSQYPAVMLDKPLGFDRNLGIGSIEIKHEFDAFDLTGTLGYQNIVSYMDSDNTDGLIYGPMFGLPATAFSSTTCSDCTDYRFEEKAWSGEVRASSKEGDEYRWTGGISVYDSRFHHHGTNSNSFGVTQNGLYDSKLDLQDYSVFGEIDIPLTDTVFLTPGLRAGYESVSRDGYYVSNGAAGTVPYFSESGKTDGGYLAGGLTLSFKPSEEHLYYASVKQGHSGPGFPYFNIDAVYGQAVSSYPPSSNWTYEIGTRHTLLDGSLTLEGSVFYNDVKNGHVNYFDLTASQFAIAALDYRTWGFEASARAEVADGLELHAGVGYTRAEFVNVDAGDASGASNGGRLPGVPEWSGSLGLTHRLALDDYGLEGELVSTSEFQFTGGRRPADVSNSFDLKNYHIVNARVGWEKENFSIYAFGRNVFDDKVELAGTSYTPTIQAVSPGLGRVVGAGVEIKF
ncbi:TonB-dependent receptor [Neorhizobium sp. NCHU2750]|uniref:TonB-dependent receptor n=1 Tax=Neorhizobium sp. NCHU2750 TaxID=1825976 RepID=UPI000E750CA1|nr:iron complex outermembrane recepter protein [Neorhizobium sp. NCHU2750]